MCCCRAVLSIGCGASEMSRRLYLSCIEAFECAKSKENAELARILLHMTPAFDEALVCAASLVSCKAILLSPEP